MTAAATTSPAGRLKFGRKPKLSPEQVEHAREQIERGKTVQEVAALLKVGRVTLWRALKA
jgi:DNA invertase Pin-like site-specific DNA recombinase